MGNRDDADKLLRHHENSSNYLVDDVTSVVSPSRQKALSDERRGIRQDRAIDGTRLLSRCARHAEQIVARLNSEPSPEKVTERKPYNMYVASHRGMQRSSGLNHAAVIICEEGKKGVCRGRSFWAIPSVKPEDLAKLAIERTISDKPHLPGCKMRDPNHRDKWVVPKDE